MPFSTAVSAVVIGVTPLSLLMDAEVAFRKEQAKLAQKKEQKNLIEQVRHLRAEYAAVTASCQQQQQQQATASASAIPGVMSTAAATADLPS